MSRTRSRVKAYYHLGRYAPSIEAANKAIEIMRAGNHLGALPDALFWRARAEEKTGEHEAALADAQASLLAIEELREHLVPSDFMKRGFAEQTQMTYSLSIHLLAASGQPDRALDVAEAARSRAFLDLPVSTIDPCIGDGAAFLAITAESRVLPPGSCLGN